MVPWHVLITENDRPPRNDPFVQFTQIRNSKNETIREIQAKYERFHNMKALVVVGNVQLRDFTLHVPVLIVPFEKALTKRLKDIFESHSRRTLLISSIPLSSSQVKCLSPSQCSHCITRSHSW